MWCRVYANEETNGISRQSLLAKLHVSREELRDAIGIQQLFTLPNFTLKLFRWLFRQVFPWNEFPLCFAQSPFCDKWIRLLICRNLEMVCKWIAWRHWYQITTEFDYRLFCDHSYLAETSHINQLLCQGSSINFSLYTLVSMVMRSKYKNIVYGMPDVPILIYNLNSWLGS